MRYRNRIAELKEVRVGDLKRSPWNWRKHPVEQRTALDGILREVGIAAPAIARRLPDGGLELIDGHLRADLANDPDAKIPVVVLDVTEEEAKKLLATFDPLAAQAQADTDLLRDLLGQFEAQDAEVRRLVDQIRDDFLRETARPPKEYAPGPKEMELLPNEHYDCLVILARNRLEWNRLCDLLGVEVRTKPGTHRVGIMRGIPAERLLALLEKREESGA